MKDNKTYEKIPSEIIKLYESAKELLEDSPTALNVRLVT
jgi:hypothetical protein